MQNIFWVSLTITLMTVSVGYVLIYLRNIAGSFSVRKLSYTVIFLTMMGSMLNSLNYYLATPPNFFNTIAAVNISMMEMTVAIVYLLWISSRYKIHTISKKVALGLSLLMVWNEVSMGSLLFTIAYSTPERYVMSGSSGFLALIVSGVNSYLFIAPMVGEMIFIFLYFKETRLKKIIFGSLIAMALSTPSMIENTQFRFAGTIVFASVMVLFMIPLYEWIANRRNSLKLNETASLKFVFSIFLLMSFGVFFGDVFQTPFYIAWLPYGIAMTCTMIFYFYEAILPAQNGSPMVGWRKNPRFLFLVLMFSFVSELFLSASIIFMNHGSPSSGWSGFIALSALLKGVDSSSIPAVILDVPYVIGAIANSYVFLTIMGIEMGALVVLRMRKIQWREKRVNLTLALISFALYTTIWPNFGPESFYSVLPVWANAGSLGPLYPSMIGVIVGSYAIYAILALLFGRRSYCSTLCPSAVMYGGTLGQAMIAYNYESEISKRHIGSRFKASVYPFISVSWVLMISLSYLSYLTAGGFDNFSIFGIDPIVFFSFFVWNFLWYLFFVSVPFLGMSPCRRYGWCTTGTFVGFFSRIGLFKLKVRDPSTCVTCPTKDCVTACEVGLGDLAGQFIKQGYFKSSKCVGSGSCLEACPYENIYFYDIRNLLREKKRS